MNPGRLLVGAVVGVALIWPASALAQTGSFYVVGLSDQSAWLADRDSIRWSGSNPTITLHQIYRTPSPLEREYGSGFDLYQRAEFRIEIDCAGRRTRDVGFTMFGFSATARPVRMTDVRAWEPVGDSEMFADLHNLACNNQPPPDTTLVQDLQVAVVAYYRTMNDTED